MDPDENLREQRRIKDRVKAGAADRHDRARLRELQAALSEWRRGGGFAPREVARQTYDVSGGVSPKRGFYSEENARAHAARHGGRVVAGRCRA